MTDVGQADRSSMVNPVVAPTLTAAECRALRLALIFGRPEEGHPLLDSACEKLREIERAGSGSAKSEGTRVTEVSVLTDQTFERTYQRTVDFIAGRFGDKETYRVFGRFLLELPGPTVQQEEQQ